MLLGVAQVVVNVADIGPWREALRGAGYRETFAEPAIPNHPAKAPLQARARERLAMAHFAAPDGGLAVELTRYEGEPPGGRAPYRFELPAAGAPARVVLAVADPEASAVFWRDALGFRDAGGGVLAFRAIRPEWGLEVELVASADTSEPTCVDADGCVLVTMLATAIDADFASLRERGAGSRAAPPWDEEVAGRSLRVAMVEGPGGELIELLQPPRES